MNRTRVTPARRWVTWLLLAIAAAIVLAQSQGLVHSLVHGQHFRGQTTAQGNAPEASREATAGSGHEHKHDDRDEARSPVGTRPDTSWLLRLFVGHDDESTCRLFDHSSHGELLQSVQAHLPPHMPAAAVLAVRATAKPPLAPTPSRARGPPTTTA